ncbi:MAG: DUF2268 domain-containing putative Zn-dependent protease [Acidobacteriota bacterium]
MSLLALTIAACDSSSPTEPAPPSPAGNIVFANPQALAPYQATITQIIEDNYRLAGTRLSIAGVRVTVTADAARTIPGFGLGGYAQGPNDIEIVVDPAFGSLETSIAQYLPHIVAHELHHAARFRGLGFARTLLDHMVLEGMADHFAVDLLGILPPPWSEALSESQITEMLQRARPELDSSAFSFQAWFFGSGADIPAWTGYSLGFHLVSEYRTRNPGSDAASLVHTPSDAFRPPS